MSFIQGTVCWGIIGCGDVCEIKSGPAFGKVSNSKLVAVMRRDPEKAKDYAQRHKVSKYYTDAHELINDPEVNAVYIATPPASHEAYALMSIEAGKPVYIEKPVTTNSQSCQNIIDASLKYNVPAVVAHYRRSLPLFVKIKELIEQNIIGAVRTIALTTLQTPKNLSSETQAENWRVDASISGGGLFYDLAPHQLDILYWIFGSPLSLSGNSLNQSKAYAAPDTTSLTAVYNKNILLNGLWSFNVPPGAAEERCKIIGEHGMLVFSFFGKPLVEIYSKDKKEVLEFPFPEHIQQPMIESVVKFFQNKGANPCSLQEAMVSLKMIEQY